MENGPEAADSGLVNGNVLRQCAPPTPWQRLCPTSRLFLLLTVFCSLLLLSVVLLGIKRAQLDRGQQEARQALESFNLTVTAMLGSHQNTIKVRMENQVDSLQRGSKAFQCDLVELRSNGSKTGCCPRNWENFRESCYWASVQRLSWANAKLDCEKKSSHLVILNSPEEKVGGLGLPGALQQEELESGEGGACAQPEEMGSWQCVFLCQAFVRQLRTSDLWIGLTDASGRWKWVDGTSYTLHPEDWDERQPDHWYGHGLGGGEDCVHTTNTGLWNDNHCSRRFFWMCEAELQS
ncbi:hypothetical protein lerEdw1_006456 [Lerista edwardsae]|nr:hypothetical protein lerEdw1_006456 [Lerista edwardsae]